MARSKAMDMELQNWFEVDRCMKKVAECELALDTIEAEMNMKVNDAKAEAKRLAEPLQIEIAEQKELIREFVEGHRAELDGKSRQLTLAASQQENIVPEMLIFAAILSGFLAVPMPVRLQKPFVYPQKIRYFSYSMFSYWEASLVGLVSGRLPA